MESFVTKCYENPVIRIRENSKYVYIDLSEIISFEALINYSKINLVDGRCFISGYTLMFFDKLLNEKNFKRINRSLLLNWDFVKEVLLKEKKIELQSGKKVEISRRKLKLYSTS